MPDVCAISAHDLSYNVMSCLCFLRHVIKVEIGLLYTDWINVVENASVWLTVAKAIKKKPKLHCKKEYIIYFLPASVTHYCMRKCDQETLVLLLDRKNRHQRSPRMKTHERTWFDKLSRYFRVIKDPRNLDFRCFIS